VSIMRLVSNEGQLCDRFCGPVSWVSRSYVTSTPPQLLAALMLMKESVGAQPPGPVFIRNEAL
jgi:hypothetical protein